MVVNLKKWFYTKNRKQSILTNENINSVFNMSAYVKFPNIVI